MFQNQTHDNYRRVEASNAYDYHHDVEHMQWQKITTTTVVKDENDR